MKNMTSIQTCYFLFMLKFQKVTKNYVEWDRREGNQFKTKPRSLKHKNMKV